MKNLVAALIVLFAAIQLSAQDISLTHQGNHFYANLISKAATLNGNWGLFGGMRAGYNINKNFSIGGVAHGLIPVKLGGSYINQDNRDELHLGYGGAEVSYNYDLSDKFYLTGLMMIGAGRVDYDKMDGYDYFFVYEPEASLGYRITDYFGLSYSIGYRLTSGVKYADFSNASFSGWSTELGLNFNFGL